MRKLFFYWVILVIILPIVFGSCQIQQSTPPKIIACFDEVIAVLDSTSDYLRLQELKLADYRRKASEATGDEEKFYYNKLITECYYEFDLDSADMYIRKNLDIAERNNKQGWVVECYLQALHLYNKVGYLEQGKEVLVALGQMDKNQDQLLKYYLGAIEYWANRAIFLNEPNPNPMSQLYADSVLMMEKDVPLSLQLHVKVWKETDNNKKIEVLNELKKVVDDMSPTDELYATLCEEVGLLSRILQTNEIDEAEYFTKNIVSTLRNVSRVAPMLSYLEKIAIRHGELDYANRFLSSLLQMQSDYPDRIRKPLYPSIIELTTAVQERLEKENNRNLKLMALAMILCVIVTILLAYVAYNLRRRVRLETLLKEKNILLHDHSMQLKKERQQLSEAIESLRENSEALKNERNCLKEANYLKEEYIGQMFATCSDYLHKIENIKKDLNRKLTARQYDLALKATTIKSEDDMKELHELWVKFDEVFLNLFPDFVEQFNQLLQPSERIVLRAGEKLNSDLRIYALVRLGINSSVKISKILGLSTQSVYNARQKMRSRATESEEEFPVRVRRLAMHYDKQDEIQEK